MSASMFVLWDTIKIALPYSARPAVETVFPALTKLPVRFVQATITCSHPTTLPPA